MAKLTKTQQKRLLVQAQEKIMKVWRANFGDNPHLGVAANHDVAKIIDKLQKTIKKYK